MDPIAKATELLQAADDCHDDHPAAAAILLRQIDADALNPGQRPRYAFLVNHLLAEKLGQPAEAWQRQQAVLAACGNEAPLPVLRQAGAAARMAGDMAAEASIGQRLADAAGVSLAQAAEFLVLAAANFQVPLLGAEAAGSAALAALAPMHGPAWQQANGLDAAAAVMTNNLASDLAERPVAELAVEPLRQALAEAAELSQGFWHRAGQWVNHERAHYLRAFTANALGDAETAELQARAGLVLLANHDHDDQERVDQAFLRSELAHALARLGRAADAQVERTQADALIEALDDAEITAWYRRRVARQQALDAGS
ncbi:MAG TPA: hypothetical protein VFY73_10715 [Ideonella sp.]|uniref:hypothetical protein n=1 Tax=Ideonella sp. TaxID=1929293 RepID=UPI002E345A56|nr:hypothetical protein [Ideonella sp.]HEX5684491.1 hypothetical protein [Ideonella sp.]